VTDFSEPVYFVVWFYNQRGGAETLINLETAVVSQSRV
jgi:hypothetical protein